MNNYYIVVSINESLVYHNYHVATNGFEAIEQAKLEMTHISNENRRYHAFLADDDARLQRKIEALKSGIKNNLKHPWKKQN